MAFPVFLDTCTLFGQVLCDYLLSIAEQGCFTPYWSVEVLDAMERSVAERQRALPEQIHRRRLFMEEAFPEAMVNGYKHLVGMMTNHPGDKRRSRPERLISGSPPATGWSPHTGRARERWRPFHPERGVECRPSIAGTSVRRRVGAADGGPPLCKPDPLAR